MSYTIYVYICWIYGYVYIDTNTGKKRWNDKYEHFIRVLIICCSFFLLYFFRINMVSFEQERERASMLAHNWTNAYVLDIYNIIYMYNNLLCVCMWIWQYVAWLSSFIIIVVIAADCNDRKSSHLCQLSHDDNIFIFIFVHFCCFYFCDVRGFCQHSLFSFRVLLVS